MIRNIPTHWGNMKGQQSNRRKTYRHNIRNTAMRALASNDDTGGIGIKP